MAVLHANNAHLLFSAHIYDLQTNSVQGIYLHSGYNIIVTQMPASPLTRMSDTGFHNLMGIIINEKIQYKL